MRLIIKMALAYSIPITESSKAVIVPFMYRWNIRFSLVLTSMLTKVSIQPSEATLPPVSHWIFMWWIEFAFMLNGKSSQWIIWMVEQNIWWTLSKLRSNRPQCHTNPGHLMEQLERKSVQHKTTQSLIHSKSGSMENTLWCSDKSIISNDITQCLKMHL